MSYEEIIKQLTDQDLHPNKIMRRDKDGLTIVGVSVYCNPLLKDEGMGVIKGIIDDGYIAYHLPNEQEIIIKKKNIS